MFDVVKVLFKYGNYLFKFCDWVADYFRVSDNIRILIKIGSVAFIVLLIVAFWKLIKKIFVRTKEIQIAKKTGIYNNVLQSTIRDKHEIHPVEAIFKGKVYKKERGSGWGFDFLNELMAGREYVANYSASVEGFVDLAGAETETKEKAKIEVEHTKGLERVVVTVSIPAGYFTTNIDFNDVSTEKDEAGLFKSKYKDDDKKKFFKEQYYEKAPKMIEDKGLIRIAKRETRDFIKQAVGGMLEGLGYKENKLVNKILEGQNLQWKNLTKAKMEELNIFKTYEVGVKFISTSWKIYRGTKNGELLGELMDPDVTR